MQRFFRHAPLWLLLLFSAVVTGCSNADQQEKPIPEQESGDELFFDYRISGEEGMEMIKTVLQYHELGPMGRAIVIPPPGSVSLDGQELSADSANFTGVYYEKMSPEAEFAGSHQISLKTASGDEFKENFDFEPIRLKEPVPAEVYRQDGINLKLSGIKNGDMLRIVATDTSFTTNDINMLEPAKEGLLTLSPVQLRSLSDGPIVLYISRELEKDVSEGTAAGGQITITYSLQRSFMLRN